jgi:hypothetical protein
VKARAPDARTWRARARRRCVSADGGYDGGMMGYDERDRERARNGVRGLRSGTYGFGGPSGGVVHSPEIQRLKETINPTNFDINPKCARARARRRCQRTPSFAHARRYVAARARRVCAAACVVLLKVLTRWRVVAAGRQVRTFLRDQVVLGGRRA